MNTLPLSPLNAGRTGFDLIVVKTAGGRLRPGITTMAQCAICQESSA